MVNELAPAIASRGPVADNENSITASPMQSVLMC